MESIRQDHFFKGLKVIELASVLAGPAVGMFFAELGAEVIKIENKTTGGDVTRRWRLPSESQEAEVSAYYCSINWGKQTEFLDLREVDDRSRVLNLISTADIVISNFKNSSAEKLGMSWSHLKPLNPGLIYAQIFAFHEDSERPAFDVVLQAEAGFLYMSGEPGRPPSKIPVALIDLIAAHQLKEGILLALLQKEKTGKGSFVGTSLFASAISSLANQATNWLMAGHSPQPMGSLHPNIAPYGEIFTTADGKSVVLAIGVEEQFKRFCKYINLPELIKDKRFKTNALRVLNRKPLYSILAQAIANYKRIELMEGLEKVKVPAGSIRNMEEVFELEQCQAMILEQQVNPEQTARCVKTVAFEIKP